jgi:hypothetical protein
MKFIKRLFAKTTTRCDDCGTPISPTPGEVHQFCRECSNKRATAINAWKRGVRPRA